MKLPPASRERPAHGPSHPSIFFRLLPFLLGLLVIAVYWPAVSNGFVNFDDDDYVALNAQVQRGLSLENVQWAFTHVVSCNWHPVTMLSHMLDCQLYGLHPWGHHLTSLLFHAANTVLLYFLLYRLTGAVGRSLLVAALFALHPLHVESVAWVAERKDVLSAFFGFLTLLCYVRHVRASRENDPAYDRLRFRPTGGYWLACVFFILGLLSKPMLVTWPFVLLLLDFWPLHRFQAGRIRSLVWEKIPFFILAAASSLMTFIIQNKEGATQSFDTLSLGLRCGNALISYGRYVLKIFWPADLAFYYPFPKYILLGWVILSAVALAGVSIFFWLQRQRRPFLLMGWLWFVGTLVPVIGLVQVGGQSMADRYAYLPSVGMFILIVWGLSEFCRRRRLLLAISIIAVVLCGMLTIRQIGFWKNAEILCRHALQVTTGNYLAQNNLGVTLYRQGSTNAAITAFQAAIQIDPKYDAAHLGLGNLLADQGATNEGLAELERAVELKPDKAEDRYYLGCQLLKQGRLDAGIVQLKAAIHFQTNSPASFKELGRLLSVNGQTNAAIAQLLTAVNIDPKDAGTHYDLANLQAGSRQTNDAISQLREAIRLRPDFVEAHNSLANLLLKKGELEPAIGELEEFVRLRPDFADAHYNLGALYFKTGQADKAAAEFQAAIRLSPNNATSHYYLGTIFIRKNQLEAAINELQTAARLQPDYAPAYNKLGIALGSAGHLPEAITAFQEALRLKPDYAEANTNLAIALKLQAGGAH